MIRLLALPLLLALAACNPAPADEPPMTEEEAELQEAINALSADLDSLGVTVEEGFRETDSLRTRITDEQAALDSLQERIDANQADLDALTRQ